MTATTTARAPMTYADLRELMAVQTGDEKHGPSAASTLDVIWVLYDQVLNVTPETAGAPDRDRFLLSKGHGPMAYYAVLAAKGFFPVSWLDRLGRFDSPLGHHPDRNLVPGVEISSGSLGHGLPLAVGLALGLRIRHVDARVFALVGDAELEEGSNAEAVAYAAAIGLGNLTVVAVDNHSSTLGWSGGLESRFVIEGWEAARVDGHNHRALAAAFEYRRESTPTLVVADVDVQQ